MSELPRLWSHQADAVDGLWRRIKEGVRRQCLVCPTGGGKSRILAELARLYLAEQEPAILYSNRRMLVEQLRGVLEGFGLGVGMRAAGHEAQEQWLFQVASIQTEHSRVDKRKEWEAHPAKLVLVDEAHNQKGDMLKAIMARHLEAGAVIVGATATPVGLAEYYDELLIAGTNSELRKCGALVPAVHYGCDEPDLRKLKVPLGADLSEKQQVQAMMRPGIFGRVWDNFQRLNPEHRPTILFAPGVRESLWFAEQFWKKGVSACHIDGEEVWINGEARPTSPEARAEALEGSRSGRICVLCNRFVLREGIDAPWLSHGILATVYGSLQSYLQSGGRLLRAFPGVEAVTVQDHGGNWWRHGSLNADREWQLDFDAGAYADVRAERLRTRRCQVCHKPYACRGCARPIREAMCWECGVLTLECSCGVRLDFEPLLCPKCQRVITGRVCPCGHKLGGQKRSRPVVSTEGVLTLHHGDCFRARTICKNQGLKKAWERIYWAARSEKWDTTFAGAEAYFAQKFKWQWPDPIWPLMPLLLEDKFRKVRNVPMSRLVPKQG